MFPQATSSAPHPGYHLKRECQPPLPAWFRAACLSPFLPPRIPSQIFSLQLPVVWTFFHAALVVPQQGPFRPGTGSTTARWPALGHLSVSPFHVLPGPLPLADPPSFLLMLVGCMYYLDPAAIHTFFKPRAPGPHLGQRGDISTRMFQMPLRFESI